MATSFAPLLLRVEEVLRDGVGVNRQLPAANRFLFDIWPGLPEEVRSVMAHRQPHAWVSIDSSTLNAAHQEMSNLAHYVTTVRLELSYFINTPFVHSRLRDVVALASDDMHRIRAALGFPGNLTATTAGADTGLAGGALRMLSWTKDEPNPEDKGMEAVMILEGQVILTNP